MTTCERNSSSTPTSQNTVPALLAEHLDVLWCPRCHAPLEIRAGALSCTGGHVFPCDGNIPLLFWPTELSGREDVTETVRAFYEETPFPNYDEIDSPESLGAKAEQGVFARLLNEQLPFGARIMEAGCGTGQLSNFLGLRWGRIVFGTDLCLNSLRLGDRFRDQHQIGNVVFLQQNLFKPTFRPETMDVVVSNGVLHHTSDPRLGFESVLGCLKPGGLVVVGLYNTYGRLTTDFRRLVFRLTSDRFTFLDPRLRIRGLSDVRKRIWFLDQYKHPHESKHTMGEVLEWFDRAGVEFLNAIPKCNAGGRFAEREQFFAPNPRGTSFDHFIVQL